MITVRKNIFIEFDEEISIEFDEEISVERMEIDVDAVEELPAPDYFEGKRLHQGSIAWVISTGEFYGMQSDGTWVNQANGEPAPASEPTAMSAPMMRMSAKPEIIEEVTESESLSEIESTEDRVLG